MTEIDQSRKDKAILYASLGSPSAKCLDANGPSPEIDMKSVSALIRQAVPALLIVLFWTTDSAHAISSYVLDPEFKRVVVPWIKDASDFVSFMDEYKEKENVTTKDKIDIIIKLGILAYEPQWISKSTSSEIDKYYPGLRQSHRQGSVIDRAKIVVFAENIDPTIVIDSESKSSKYAQATLIAPLLIAPAVFESTEFALVIATIVKANPQIGKDLALDAAIGSVLTKAAINAIQGKTPSKSQTDQSSVPITEKSNADSIARGCKTDPGYCTVEECIEIQTRIKNSCKDTRRCRPEEEINVTNRKRENINACISNRVAIMSVCFKDKMDVNGHLKRVIELKKQLYDCDQMMNTSGGHPDMGYPTNWQYLGH